MQRLFLGACLAVLLAGPAAAMTSADEMAGDAAFNANRNDAAIAAYERAVKLNPGKGDLLMKTCRVYAVTGKQLNRALELCNGAVRANGFDPAAHNVRGLVYYRLGQYQKALADYEMSLRRRPNHAGSLYMRGLTYLKLHDMARGQTDINAAIRLDAGIDSRMAAYGIRRY